MKLVSIISLLLCFSLQAQQKRWQLDSIQQIQFYSDKIEYVYKTFHQSYDPKTRTVTMIDETKGKWSDKYKYVCEYSPQDSLLSKMVYKYDRSIKDWREREMIHYVYMGTEIQERIYDKNEKGDWQPRRTFYFENIEGKLYLKKEESRNNTEKGWGAITYDPPEEWYHFSMQETAYKKNVAPKVKYNAKGEAIEMLFIRKNGYKDKQKLSYDDLGNIHELELYELRDSNIGLKKEEKRVYTYAPDILYEEVLDKWMQNDKNRKPKNAILFKKVYRHRALGGYQLIYEHHYFYSPIKQ